MAVINLCLRVWRWRNIKSLDRIFGTRFKSSVAAVNSKQGRWQKNTSKWRKRAFWKIQKLFHWQLKCETKKLQLWWNWKAYCNKWTCCFQRLFPRLSKDKKKYSDAMCQRDLVYQHKSHDKCPKKKHVLVSHEHSNYTDN